MNEHKYTVTVPMSNNVFQSWTNEYRRLREEFVELQIAATGYLDAIAVIDQIKKNISN